MLPPVAATPVGLRPRVAMRSVPAVSRMSRWNRARSPRHASNSSSSRTDPMGCDSLHWMPEPSTRLTSTEPPPRSMSSQGSRPIWMRRATAPWTSRASSAPEMTSMLKPVSLRTRIRSWSWFAASRTALVATTRTCSTSASSRSRWNPASAFMAESMVSLSIEPYWNTLCPRRTAARCWTRTFERSSSICSMAMHRMPFEPRSMQPTRNGNEGASFGAKAA